MQPIKINQQLPEVFLNDVRSIIESGRRQAYSAAGSILLTTYWNIGRRIVEEEQKGNSRAEYGRRLIADLADNLKKEYGPGYGKRNLAYFRRFYLSFPDIEILHEFVQNLTWTHIRRLLSVTDPTARQWYLSSNTIRTNNMSNLTQQSTEVKRPFPKAQLLSGSTGNRRNVKVSMALSKTIRNFAYK